MPEKKGKGGRPPKPVPKATADKIVAWITSGGTLREYCKKKGAPNWGTVYLWMQKDSEFSQRIALAREAGHDALSEECLYISDHPEYGVTVEDRSGTNPGRTIKKGDMVDRAKLKIWTRLQLLAKWNPKKYGDRVALDHTVKTDIVERLNAGRRRAGK